MARYFLHLRDFQGDVLEDVEGCELPSLAAAREEAILAMRDFVAVAIKQGDELPVKTIIIANEQGSRLAAVPLIAALPSTISQLFKHPEQVIPPERFGEYRRFADECRAKAENTADPDDKVSWLKLADAWLLMLPPTLSPSVAGWPRASDEDSKASH